MLADVIIYPTVIRIRGRPEPHELTNKAYELYEKAKKEYEDGILNGEKPFPQKLLEIFAEKLKQNNIPYIYLKKLHVPEKREDIEPFLKSLAELYYKPIIEAKLLRLIPRPDLIVTEVGVKHMPVAEDAIDPPEVTSPNNMENMFSILLLSIPIVTLIGLWLSNIFRK